MEQAATETVVLQTPGKGTVTERLVSLDAFRGAIIALMVLVNTAGDGRHTYAPLEHAEWDGWTPTDVVFPSFMWIVGVAITLSFGKRLVMGVSRGKLFAQAARRALVLYVLGLIVYAYPFNLSTQRWLGVLQRIAICYLIAAGIYLTTKVRGQIIWIISLLTVYWVLMTFVPVPGFGPGRLDVEGNFAHYVDRIVLGTHNYHATKTWDPEGIVSTIPAIATVLFGIMAGHILRLKQTLAERTTWLFLAGNLLLAAGLIFNMWMPINKKLWSDSFTLFMAGLDFVMFAIVTWVADGLGHKRALKPFIVMGMNAIAVYMSAELIDITLSAIHLDSGISLRRAIYQNVFEGLASPNNASLMYALTYVLLMFCIAWFLYRKRWFLKA